MGTDLPPGAQYGVASERLMALWAKHGTRPGYHPLLYHLIDVASVALALWDLALTPYTRGRVARALGLTEAEARSWVAFLAGVHDLGKATIAFERQVAAALPRLDSVGMVGGPAISSHAPHGAVSALELRSLLPTFGMDPRVAERCAAIVGAHHGCFYDRGRLKEIPRAAIGVGEWAQVRQDLATRLAVLLELPKHPPGAVDAAMATWLAGLISVADWIGSDERFFPWAADDGTVPAFDRMYPSLSAGRAQTALRELGWQAQPGSVGVETFVDLFSFAPNEVQRAVVDLRPTEQGLVIVESQTGSGKTEAAMWLADSWSRVLGTRGFYVALPTQATSNQMFGRVIAYLRRRYPHQDVNVQLLHGHASLSAELEALRREELHCPSDIDAGEGDVLAAEWFTRRKRGLLAPFGVGTVDQLLLAILQTRHHFVRLFGIAGKTIIIDEVHAYDTYMSTLLETLLRWLAALGSPVVLLSATLPDSRRHALAQAYAEGMGREAADLGTAPYPRLTWVGTAAVPNTIALEAPPNRFIQLRWIEEGDLISDLLRVLGSGGVAAVVCNSVARAQDMYLALREHVPPEQLDLLHARYPYEERARRESRTLRRFGKDGDRPERMILVSTQIVEQSLDIDFDLLVTDLAPVDLLIQRIGRLHRHIRPDRPMSTAEAWILRPRLDGNGLPYFEDRAHWVYSPYILLRTWIALQGRSELSVPGDVQALVEAVYDGDGFPAVSDGLQRRLEDLWQKHEAAVKEEEYQAHLRRIRDPAYTGQLADIARDPRAEESPDLHPAHQALTRLAEPSVPIVLVDENGALPDGTAVNPAKQESNPLTRALLGQSVTISSSLCVRALADKPVPTGWERSPLLRNHRPLRIPRGGEIRVGSASIALDPDLGVVIKSWKGEK